MLYVTSTDGDDVIDKDFGCTVKLKIFDAIILPLLPSMVFVEFKIVFVIVFL
jgi:hypothetical protein